MRLLLAEDDPDVATSLSTALEREGHAVDVVHSGLEAEWMAKEASFDALILDVSLPGLSGIQLAEQLRAAGVWTPILMLTGHGETTTKVAGLDAGADDYVVKPTTVSEVLARLRAITRRGGAERPTVIEVGDVVVDPAGRRAYRDGVPLALTPKEFALLELLVRRRGETVSREELEEKLWDFAFAGTSNVVDALVRRLRAKIDDPFTTPVIETVRGHGYRFHAPD